MNRNWRLFLKKESDVLRKRRIIMNEEFKVARQDLAKIAEKNLARVKDKLLEDTEMPLMERKAMMSIAKNAAKMMAYSVSMGEIASNHSWIKI